MKQIDPNKLINHIEKDCDVRLRCYATPATRKIMGKGRLEMEKVFYSSLKERIENIVRGYVVNPKEYED